MKRYLFLLGFISSVSLATVYFDSLTVENTLMLNGFNVETELDGKEPTITGGTNLQYWRGDKTFQTLNTSVVPESGNLYFTDARARLSLSATAPILYNNTTGDISIPDAAADGSTKGAASFSANDFNASSGNISIDYTNGQAASSSAKGFLTSSDWTTFNGKQAGPLTGDVTTSGAAATIANDAVTNAKMANMAEATFKGRFPLAGTGDPTDLTTTQMAEMIGLMGLPSYTSPTENDYLFANENASGLNKRLALGTLADYASNAFITVYSSGSGTHNFNPNVATFKAVLIGGGGGGGSGRTTGAGGSRFGGGGGGGGAYVVFEGRPTLTSIDYSVGAGGDGGAANPTPGTNGNSGTAGGNTTISDSNGLLVTAQGGDFGAGGQVGAGGGGGTAIAASCYVHPATAAYTSSAGGNGSTTAPTAGGAMAVAGPTGGGGGGGINTSNVRGAGAAGGAQGPSVAVWQNPGGAGGAAETAVLPAEDGADGFNLGSYFGVGGGGGGGASGTSGTLFSGRGGDGGLWGGGGGGGGAALNGVEASRGGNGGDGVVIIYEYLDR